MESGREKKMPCFFKNIYFLKFLKISKGTLGFIKAFDTEAYESITCTQFK